MKLFVAILLCFIGLFVSGARRCERNMRYMECGTPCERNCDDVVNSRPSSSCLFMCQPPGCYCSPGFVRFYDKQRCVAEPECLLAKK
uniref:TIL domain-containing protein n=1 Tax=Romanomermis culicivorax TaxID=13658 RepID=A0A915IWG0_ROMCU